MHHGPIGVHEERSWRECCAQIELGLYIAFEWVENEKIIGFKFSEPHFGPNKTWPSSKGDPVACTESFDDGFS